MKIFRSIGLMLVFVASLLVSCTSDNVMTGSSQVENQEVVFNLFEHSISGLGTRGDGSENKALADCGLFSELELALVPKGGTMESAYCIRQDDSMEGFGQMKLQVPAGTYQLVIVAANTPKPINTKNRIDIKSLTEVDFPNNQVSDMAYCYQEVTVASTTGKTQTIDCVLKRAVACVTLETTDKVLDNMKSFSINISGNLGNVFNPSTGHCLAKAPINKVVNVSKLAGKGLTLDIYVLLGEDDVSDVSLSTTATDTDGKEIKSTSFQNVHLVAGKRTTYKGPFFSYTNKVSVSVTEADITDSGFSKVFE